MARKVVKHHFGKSLEKIEFKPAGKTNFVFDVVTKEGKFYCSHCQFTGKAQ